jgi:hypothetical protein
VIAAFLPANLNYNFNKNRNQSNKSAVASPRLLEKDGRAKHDGQRVNNTLRYKGVAGMEIRAQEGRYCFVHQ